MGIVAISILYLLNLIIQLLKLNRYNNMHFIFFLDGKLYNVPRTVNFKLGSWKNFIASKNGSLYSHKG